MSKVTMPPVSVIVESDYELRWVGAEPIAQLVARTGARVGSVFITTTQAEAYKDACVREALEEAALLCQSEGDEWDSDAVVTNKNYAHTCRDRIRALLPSTPARPESEQ